MKIEKTVYGTTENGIEVPSFTITNSNGAYIELVAYGATLNKIVVPDRDGNLTDVLVGFDTMAGQELCTDSQGRTVGRVANRIAGKGINHRRRKVSDYQKCQRQIYFARQPRIRQSRMGK